MSNIHYTRMGDLGMRLKFLNGTIVVPDEYGAYVIASGCGSGKTTVIKQIIKDNYKTGILYSALTIEECDLMYQYCKTLVDETSEDGLKLSDIIVLHSNHNSEGVDNNLWRNHPEKLLDKRIIICTHHKIMNEDPRFLCKTSFNIQKDDEIDMYSGALTRSSTEPLPRRYILVDEVPGSGDSIILDKTSLLKFTSRIDEETLKLLPESASDNFLKNKVTREDGVLYSKADSYSLFRKLYNAEKKYDKSIALVKDTSNEVSRSREGLLLSSIYKNYSSAWNELNNGDATKVKISSNFLNIVHSRIEASVLVFDGTGDLTFYGSDRFKILTTNNVKYNSHIDLIKFPSDLKRRQSSSRIENLEDELKSSIDKLENIVRSNQRTLIVTWKNLRNSDEESREFIESKVNESKSLPEFYRSTLIGRGLVEGKDFDIIHYQSGLDRATNKFIDCDSIVFLGEFHVPNSVIDEFNFTFGCKTTPEFYLLYQLAQAVCRTRIRKHKGYPIKIYFSDDWDDRVMTSLVLYFTGKYPSENFENSKAISTYDPELKYIKSRFRDDIKSMITSGLFPGLEESLSTGTPMSYRVKFKDLFEAIPRSNYQTRSYNALVKYLSSLMIKLNIETDSNNS